MKEKQAEGRTIYLREGETGKDVDRTKQGDGNVKKRKQTWEKGWKNNDIKQQEWARPLKKASEQI